MNMIIISAGIAFFAGWIVTALASRLLMGAQQFNPTPTFLALQTRQDIAGVFGAHAISNGLLAAILVTLLFR